MDKVYRRQANDKIYLVIIDRLTLLISTLFIDVPTILNLIIELAEYEKSLDQVDATISSLRSTLSFPSKTSSTGWTQGYAKTLLILPPATKQTPDSAGNPTVAGMALYFHNYSTWTAAPGIYVEDLFVRPEFRGLGYGRALLRELARQGLKVGCRRMDWSVLDWNQSAVDFYVSDRIGGKIMEGWKPVRVEVEDMERLAANND